MSEEARYRCQSCKHLDFWWRENIGRRQDVAVGICHAPGVGTGCPIGLAKAEGRCDLYAARDRHEHRNKQVADIPSRKYKMWLESEAEDD